MRGRNSTAGGDASALGLIEAEVPEAVGEEAAWEEAAWGAGLQPGGGSRGALFGGLGMRANVQPFRLFAIKVFQIEM